MTASGLSAALDSDGYQYFIANRSDKPVDSWITLGTPAQSAVLMDPRFDNRSGVAAQRFLSKADMQIYLQLLPGESRILRTFINKIVTGPAWPNVAPAGTAQEITGTWDVKFVEGGPELPAAFTATNLASWTTRDDPEAKRFAGTARYSSTSIIPPGRPMIGCWTWAGFARPPASKSMGTTWARSGARPGKSTWAGFCSRAKTSWKSK